ncbi:leucine zipper protein 1 isoform X1 [Stegostoma tigrinum]|uniref:leucine zipper protein 1 isoform X1 n=1 Tax=Stegostoma tigrinum TaxID=3053191 RepID=UPI00202B0777|nr:leucine zipper protein 1 isoform X1 [Stegostoma tigrinum]XP_048414310.1 leucine zipper protein 1 isoform X1 [Stegostoma tigrinum]XP_048414312.1 leucine zipper protein 1 isoform X1 [Stegostoma tigrinum]
MTDTMSLKETSNRHLRLKLTSLGRRVDELEEATRNLHRTEDELMDLQDKVIQAEGSSSSLLTEVDNLRKRVLTIEGKDEEVRKAEDMCRTLKEKLEAEVKLSQELKAEIEELQDRMGELEKLEEAFNKSKSDCTQLCLSLNEEKNLTRKLITELEVLRARVKDLESTEGRLDKSEKSIIEELEKLKSLTVVLAEERKTMNETLKQKEQVIQDLTKKLEQNNKINETDQSWNSSNLRTNVSEKTYNYSGDRGDLRIEDDLSSGLSPKGSLAKKSLDFLNTTHNVGLRNKGDHERQEDNKIKDLTQEIERLKKRLKLLEMVEEDLKKTEAKHNELQERFLNEQSKTKMLADQIEEMKLQMTRSKAVENGESAHQEIRYRSRQDKTKCKSVAAAEPQVLKEKTHEVLYQPRSQREKVRNRDLLLDDDSTGKSYRRPLSPSVRRRFQRPSSNPRTASNEKKSEDKSLTHSYISAQKDQDLQPEKLKKTREPPSVLSRYPPAANESSVKRPWNTQSKQSENGPKSKADTVPRDYIDLQQSSILSDKQRKAVSYLHNSENENSAAKDEVNDSGEDSSSTSTTASLLNGMFPSYRNHTASPTSSSELKDADLLEGEVPMSTNSELTAVKSAERLPIHEDPETTTEVLPVTTRPRRSRYFHSAKSQDMDNTDVRCNTERQPLCYKPTETIASEDVAANQKPGLELKRICSPREGLRSKAIIKPAIIAIDKKEIMTTGAEPVDEEHGLSPKTVPNKVTSSITIPPSSLSSQRINSTVIPKEKHTSTSNITISSSETTLQRSNISIPYEISIRRSDITMKPSESDSSDEDETESGAEVLVSSSITIKSPRYEEGDSGVAPYEARRRSRVANQAETETRSLPVDPPERASWRKSRSGAQVEPTCYGTDLGTDFSRVTVRKASRALAASDVAEPSGSSRGALTDGYTRRVNNFSNSSDSVEVKSSLTSDTGPHRSYYGTAENLLRRKQNATVASKVADWNNTCSLAGQDSSDTQSALNSNLLSKRKEIAKQILSDMATERMPRSETVDKRQSVKLELRRNPAGSPTHQSGPRTEEKTPVGILSQIRMTSRR